MGRGNEYSYDAFAGEDVIEEQEEETGEDHLDPESWEMWHSEHLLNMWMGIRAYLQDNSLNSTIIPNATYHDFLQFIHEFS